MDSRNKPKDPGASVSRMFVFGTGDIYGSAISVYSFFYAKFVTDVICLEPIYAGVVWLLTNIWDAAIDPVMGYLSDITRSRFGRRRVFFIAGMLPVFVSFFLLWNPVRLASTGVKFAYVLTTSLLFKSVYTMVMVPYNAMRTEFTLDYALRNRLALMGMIFSSAATALAYILPPALADFGGDSLSGYTYMALILGLLFTLPWPLVLLSTRGMDNFPPAKRSFIDFVRTTLGPFGFKSFRRFAVMYLSAIAALDLISMLFVYYADYYLLGSGGGFSFEKLIVPIGGALIVQAAAVPVYNGISKRSGKHAAYIVSGVLWILGCAVIFLLPPLSSPASVMWLLPLGMLMGAGISGIMIMTGSILSDMAEVGELKFGERREGMFSGLMLFLRKGGDALINFLALASLGLAGYAAPVGNIKQPQPESVLLVIRIFLAAVPALLILAGIIAAAKYPLGARLHAMLNFYLKKRREGIELDSKIGDLLFSAVIGGKNGIVYNKSVERDLLRMIKEAGGTEEEIFARPSDNKKRSRA